jgi:hypothetical protein
MVVSKYLGRSSVEITALRGSGFGLFEESI